MVFLQSQPIIPVSGYLLRKVLDTSNCSHQDSKNVYKDMPLATLVIAHPKSISSASTQGQEKNLIGKVHLQIILVSMSRP